MKKLVEMWRCGSRTENSKEEARVAYNHCADELEDAIAQERAKFWTGFSAFLKAMLIITVSACMVSSCCVVVCAFIRWLAHLLKVA